MREVHSSELADIARGAAILGSGGGGNPHMGLSIAQRAVAAHGPVTVVSLAELPPDAVVVPVAVMGVPTIFQERILAGDEALRAIQVACIGTGHAPTYLMPCEIGGVNAMTPFAPAAELGLPVLDCDFMGRAFPEIPMIMPSLMNVILNPMILADDKGNVVTIRAVGHNWQEPLARTVSLCMGGTAVVAFGAMAGKDVSSFTVAGTVSCAQALGQSVREAREQHLDPVEAACSALNGLVLIQGKVIDIERNFVDGFIRGRAVIDGVARGEGATLKIDFQNEYLLATRSGIPVATTPDLICVLEEETGEALPADVLRYGARVAVIAAPCDPRWRTLKGLEIVGPSRFGYDCDYHHFSESFCK